MDGIDPGHVFGLSYTVNIQVDHDWLLPAAGYHTLERLVVACIDLLVRHEWRYKDEPARAGFGGEFEIGTPPHPGPAANYVDHAFQLAMMVRPGLCARVDRGSSGRQLLRAGPVMGDRSGARHPWRLRSVGVQRIARDDANTLGPPVRRFSWLERTHVLR